MLLLETTLSHVIVESDRPLAIVSARRPDQSGQDNLESTKRLAAAARDAGFGFQVVEGNWTSSGAQEWPVLVVADVNSGSHLLGHCRNWMKEFEQDFVLFRKAASPDILHFVADGSRKGALVGTVRLESGGLILPDGRTFTFGRAFHAAGWFTGLAYSRGAEIGVAL